MHSSEGIVLNSIKYGDSSLVLRVLTPDRGLRSFLISGVRKHRSSVGAAVVQPLSIAHWVYYEKPEGLERVKEVKTAFYYTRLCLDVPLTSAGLLLVELTAHCHHEPAPTPEVYDLLRHTLTVLDQNADIRYLPLWYAVKLSQALGFAPEVSEAQYNNYFDLRESCFSRVPPTHGDYLLPDECALLGITIENHQPANPPPDLTGELALRLLTKWIRYHQYHIAQFGQLKTWPTYKQFAFK